MEGCSKTEIIKFQKVGCLQALFGLGAGFGPADFKSPVSTDSTTTTGDLSGRIWPLAIWPERSAAVRKPRCGEKTAAFVKTEFRYVLISYHRIPLPSRVTADPGSARRPGGNGPETTPARGGPWLSGNPRSAWRRCRTPCFRLFAPPDT